MRRRAVVLVLYLAAAVGWIYGVVDNGSVWSGIPSSLEYGLTVVIYFALGFALRSWWALLLPAVTVLIALPAGHNAQMCEFDVVAFDPLAAVPFGVVGAVLGVALARRRGTV